MRGLRLCKLCILKFYCWIALLEEFGGAIGVRHGSHGVCGMHVRGGDGC